jgi:hypothetical protein
MAVTQMDNAKTASWCMTGTPIVQLTNIQGGQLTIHGLFTGSIQGIKSVENQQSLTFVGTNTSATMVYQTNSPTIAFSDASSVSTPYPATGNFSEDSVCVQPFVIVRSASSGYITNVNNVTWDQLKYGIGNGYIPLSVWTGNPNDGTNYVYMIERTLDSGSRRVLTAEHDIQYGGTVGVYIYDFTNQFFFPGNNSSNSAVGSSPYGVVGSAGLNNANLAWGPGYVSGGNIATEMGYTSVSNNAIAILSMSDCQTILSGNTNFYSQVISFNGLWPTTAASGIHGNYTTNNNYAPITLGSYPLWGNEVVVLPNIDPTSLPGETGQNLTAAQLGNQATPGTILGVLDDTNATPQVGSIDNEIFLSETNYAAGAATAIRASEMVSSRQAVGGVITP